MCVPWLVLLAKQIAKQNRVLSSTMKLALVITNVVPSPLMLVGAHLCANVTTCRSLNQVINISAISIRWVLCTNVLFEWEQTDPSNIWAIVPRLQGSTGGPYVQCQQIKKGGAFVRQSSPLTIGSTFQPFAKENTVEYLGMAAHMILKGYAGKTV